MKRNIEVIQEILEWCEDPDNSKTATRGVTIEIPSRSKEVIDYHLWLCEDRELVEIARDVHPPFVNRIVRIRLTWEGHDMLDDLRQGGE